MSEPPSMALLLDSSADEDESETGAEELLAASLPRWFRGPLVVLYVPLLPLIIARFLLDRDRDFRLRLIVLLFVLATAFEAVAAFNG